MVPVPPSRSGTESTAPEPLLSPRETEPDDAKRIGVLRAVLDGDQLTGEVMVPRMSGVVKISMTGSLGLEPLSEVTIGARGEFTLDAPDLEKIKGWIESALSAVAEAA